MSTKWILGLAIAGMLASDAASAAPDGHGRHAWRRARHAPHVRVHTPHHRAGSVHVVFGTGDVRVIRRYYVPPHRHLPPGLRRKLARAHRLPPGWARRFEPFPVIVERRLAPLPPGYRRGVLDGHAVIFDTRTHVIVDVAVLF